MLQHETSISLNSVDNYDKFIDDILHGSIFYYCQFYYLRMGLGYRNYC